MKFPPILHVLRQERPGRGEPPFLVIVEEGALDPGIPETTPCAIYKLVDVGKIEVSRQFKSSKRKA